MSSNSKLKRPRGDGCWSLDETKAQAAGFYRMKSHIVMDVDVSMQIHWKSKRRD
ncbi:hypothetical protein ACFQ38_03105 [Sporosarcina contaminans]|uniref:Transposase DDE domain-containing protein n=1 Tax=Sporosarcina contaminans TaxID=633403 RepID=A0ABW3TTZ9_9BACL